jgi:hypothetical protein
VGRGLGMREWSLWTEEMGFADYADYRRLVEGLILSGFPGLSF